MSFIEKYQKLQLHQPHVKKAVPTVVTNTPGLKVARDVSVEINFLKQITSTRKVMGLIVFFPAKQMAFIYVATDIELTSTQQVGSSWSFNLR